MQSNVSLLESKESTVDIIKNDTSTRQLFKDIDREKAATQLKDGLKVILRPSSKKNWAVFSMKYDAGALHIPFYIENSLCHFSFTVNKDDIVAYVRLDCVSQVCQGFQAYFQESFEKLGIEISNDFIKLTLRQFIEEFKLKREHEEKLKAFVRAYHQKKADTKEKELITFIKPFLLDDEKPQTKKCYAHPELKSDSASAYFKTKPSEKFIIHQSVHNGYLGVTLSVSQNDTLFLKQISCKIDEDNFEIYQGLRKEMLGQLILKLPKKYLVQFLEITQQLIQNAVEGKCVLSDKDVENLLFQGANEQLVMHINFQIKQMEDKFTDCISLALMEYPISVVTQVDQKAYYRLYDKKSIDEIFADAKSKGKLPQDAVNRQSIVSFTEDKEAKQELNKQVGQTESLALSLVHLKIADQFRQLWNFFDMGTIEKKQNNLTLFEISNLSAAQDLLIAFHKVISDGKSTSEKIKLETNNLIKSLLTYEGLKNHENQMTKLILELVGVGGQIQALSQSKTINGKVDVIKEIINTNESKNECLNANKKSIYQSTIS